MFPEATLEEEDEINNVGISWTQNIRIPKKEKLLSYTFLYKVMIWKSVN